MEWAGNILKIRKLGAVLQAVYDTRKENPGNRELMETELYLEYGEGREEYTGHREGGQACYTA